MERSSLFATLHSQTDATRIHEPRRAVHPWRGRDSNKSPDEGRGAGKDIVLSLCCFLRALVGLAIR